MTHYEVLGLPRTAAAEEIKTAYRALVKRFHPDRLRHANDHVRHGAEEFLKTINEAYRVLNDAQRRAAYDAQLPPDYRSNYAQQDDTPSPNDFDYTRPYTEEETPADRLSPTERMKVVEYKIDKLRARREHLHHDLQRVLKPQSQIFRWGIAMTLAGSLLILGWSYTLAPFTLPKRPDLNNLLVTEYFYGLLAAYFVLRASGMSFGGQGFVKEMRVFSSAFLLYSSLLYFLWILFAFLSNSIAFPIIGVAFFIFIFAFPFTHLLICFISWSSMQTRVQRTQERLLLLLDQVAYELSQLERELTMHRAHATA